MIFPCWFPQVAGMTGIFCDEIVTLRQRGTQHLNCYNFHPADVLKLKWSLPLLGFGSFHPVFGQDFPSSVHHPFDGDGVSFRHGGTRWSVGGEHA